VEFKKCCAFTEDSPDSRGDLQEYDGSQMIENELIMSSPDKLMFMMKDLVAHLSSTYKKNLNPFFISKLDLYTVHYFNFPEMTQTDFKLLTQMKNDVGFTRNFIEN